MEFVRDWVAPIGPIVVSIAAPTIFFYLIPRRWNRRQLALDLFTSFFSEEMRHARAQGWAYFIAKRAEEPTEAEWNRRVQLFLQYLAQPGSRIRLSFAEHETFQKVSRVLDFFAVVDGCLGRNVIDEGMVRDFLRYYYLWWRQDILLPLQQQPNEFSDAGLRPPWLSPLHHLDRACGVKKSRP